MHARVVGWIAALAALLHAGGCARPVQPDSDGVPGATASWLEQAQRQLAAREYRPGKNDEGLQAPNRAHGLRTWFERTGIRIQDRTAREAPELLHLSLVGVGRGSAVAQAAPGDLATTETGRVEIRRPGLVEWYVNSPAGLEQGFTVERRPSGDGALVVELAVAGARIVRRDDAIVFETEAGRHLRYGALAAVDANRRALRSHFESSDPQRLRIVVDDAAAAYPIVIDPLFTGTADTQIGTDQIALLGSSVAGAGDVNGDGYDDVIVGAVSYDNGANDGAAFVFLGSASGIASGDASTAATQLVPDEANASFGEVAGAGDVNGDGYDDVIVGASTYSTGGGAFVFLGSASGIASGDGSTAATRLVSDQQGCGRFGRSVAGAGDVNGDGYDDVIVGARHCSFDLVAEGGAFLYLGSATGIAHGGPSTAAAHFEGDQGDSGFGAGVAGAGDVNGDGYADVIVGAPEVDSGQLDEGAAYLYLGSTSGIPNGNTSTFAAKFESNEAGAGLGYGVAAAGDVDGDGYGDVIVGAHGMDPGGAAFIFRGSATGIASGNPATAATSLVTTQTSAPWPPGFGLIVAGAGDVNADGYSDVVVGALLYDAGEQDEGAAFVFLGSALGVLDGTAETAPVRIESNQANANLGYVAGAGDVNGDGGDDVIAGAYRYDAGHGAALLYLPETEGVLSLACGVALAAALARARRRSLLY